MESGPRRILMDQQVITLLERRVGRKYVRQRLGIERDHEIACVRRQYQLLSIRKGIYAPWLIRGALRLSGIYGRAQKHAERIEVCHNLVCSMRLPKSFDGLRILHISD